MEEDDAHWLENIHLPAAEMRRQHRPEPTPSIDVFDHSNPREGLPQFDRYNITKSTSDASIFRYPGFLPEYDLRDMSEVILNQYSSDLCSPGEHASERPLRLGLIEGNQRSPLHLTFPLSDQSGPSEPTSGQLFSECNQTGRHMHSNPDRDKNKNEHEKTRHVSVDDSRITIQKIEYTRPSQEKVYCGKCNIKPEGFRGPHELRRHIDNKHLATRKAWICKDKSPNQQFLSNCKACRDGKEYGACYNAAAHLRRIHFNPKGKVKKSNKFAKARGRDGAGQDPPMAVLKLWMEEIDIPISQDHDSGSLQPDPIKGSLCGLIPYDYSKAGLPQNDPNRANLGIIDHDPAWSRWNPSLNELYPTPSSSSRSNATYSSNLTVPSSLSSIDMQRQDSLSGISLGGDLEMLKLDSDDPQRSPSEHDGDMIDQMVSPSNPFVSDHLSLGLEEDALVEWTDPSGTLVSSMELIPYLNRITGESSKHQSSNTSAASTSFGRTEYTPSADTASNQGSSGQSGEFDESSSSSEVDDVGLAVLKVKHEMLVSLMREVYMTLKSDWNVNFRTCATSSSETSSGRTQELCGKVSSGSRQGKRQTQDEDSSFRDDIGRDKRRKKEESEAELRPQSRRYACPCHKYSPGKYSVNYITGATYRTCTGPGFTAISRLK